MKELFIAADCGGTKIDLLAFDEGGQVLARSVTKGGVNPKITEPAVIEANIKTATEALKSQLPDAEFASACGYFMHNQTYFSKITGIPAYEYDEGFLGLRAAGINGDGVLILCGTGADAYVIKDGKTADIVGGYGSFLGDEGSGFAIGQAGINAAIRGYEQRGEKTLLTDLLCEKYPALTFRQTVYGVYRSVQPAKEIADFCIDCEKAADLGDKTAISIFSNAADCLCSFALSAYSRYFDSKTVPFTFSGGVIRHDLKRASSLMAKRVLCKLAENGINNYIAPERDPVYGAIGCFLNKTV